ncbi:MAG TPA: P-loop NTPase [Gaiellaceae bacterium]|nr:P-loop NTPase [Gaiellaceae bacterium]
MDAHEHREQTIADYFAVIRRYKWPILVAVLVVPAVAYTMSARQPKVYRATADVLVNRQDLGSTVTGITTQGFVDPDRFMRNQAALARVPAVTQAAVAEAGARDLEGWELAGMSDVTPKGSTDLLAFGVNNGDPALAARLATAYAEAFVAYKLEMETTTLARARQEIQGRLAELRDAGASNTDAYRELQRKAIDLRTLEVLQTPASVVRPASGSSQIAPAPRRNATLGVLLGLMLGVGGAFVLNALDRRVRLADEVERELQIPLLAKLPTPRRNDPPTILERPPDEVTEAVARLRTSFDFANAESKMKLVMATSAGEREGKSTTVTNLAIALARSGRQVVLVDLDLRRPSLARLLHLPDRAGMTDVAAGTAELADALQPVVVTPLRARLSGIGRSDAGSGTLEVITAGRTRVDPGEFVEGAGLAHVLQALRSRAEIVLVDTPPVLATGDAMALSGKVDALLLISRLGTLTRPALRELVRMLGRSPAPVLGWVATGAEVDESYSTYRAHESYLSPPRPRVPDEVPPPARLEVPEPRSASAGSGRWTPRRSGG